MNLTIPAAHYKVSKQALLHGKHVYTEKPLAINFKDGKRLIELAKKKSLMYGVCFQNRLNPAVRHLAEAVFAKRFGKFDGKTTGSVSTSS